jgi:nucleotide-binding universal stress UspA family protein
MRTDEKDRVLNREHPIFCERFVALLNPGMNLCVAAEPPRTNSYRQSATPVLFNVWFLVQQSRSDRLRIDCQKLRMFARYLRSPEVAIVWDSRDFILTRHLSYFMSFKKILAAIDESPLSQTVFQQALDLAKQNQAELRFFHALTNDVMAAPLPLSADVGLSQQLIGQAYQTRSHQMEQQGKQIHTLLQCHCQTAHEQGVSAAFDCKIQEPGTGLCQVAKQWNADLIILGRRGRTGLAEVLLGSVSNYVLHHAPCAVLVIQ